MTEAELDYLPCRLGKQNKVYKIVPACSKTFFFLFDKQVKLHLCFVIVITRVTTNKWIFVSGLLNLHDNFARRE